MISLESDCRCARQHTIDDCLRSRDMQHQDGAGLEVLQVAIVFSAISDQFLNEKTLQTPRHIWTETVDAEKVST